MALELDTRVPRQAVEAGGANGLSAGQAPIGPVNAVGRRWPGTLAQVNPEGWMPLSLQEQEHLLTRVAVPCRDPTLSASTEAIRQRRQQEQAASNLVPTSRWHKRWLPPYEKNYLPDRL